MPELEKDLMFILVNLNPTEDKIIEDLKASSFNNDGSIFMQNGKIVTMDPAIAKKYEDNYGRETTIKIIVN